MTRRLQRVGFHWRSTFQHDNVPNWDTWLREIDELGIGSLFICHDVSGMRHYNPATGSLDWGRLPSVQPGIEGMVRDLLSIGVEPAVRLSDFKGIRPNAVPAQVLESLAKAGVTHVQIWNEPNDDREWGEDKRVPADWASKSIEWALPACRLGLSLGLEMSVPPINPGVDVNQFQIIVEKGGGDLFEKGLAVNIHLYPFNRLIWKGKPYPFDDIVQGAEQLTVEEYEALDRWYWHGFPREYINEIRRKDARPGTTIMDDADNFMGWLVHQHHMQATLGPNAAVPCRITEMGPRPWQDLDKRYPRLTPEEHARQVSLVSRWLQGEVDLGGYWRPEWIKAGYFWIIGGKVVGDYSQIFEADAFYGDWFFDRREARYNYPQTPIGHMPAVDALKALAREAVAQPAPDPQPQPDPTPQPQPGPSPSPADSTLWNVVGHLNAAVNALAEARRIIQGEQ